MAPNEQNPFIGLVDIEKGVQNFARQFVEVFEEVKRALEPAGGRKGTPSQSQQILPNKHSHIQDLLNRIWT